MRKGNKTIAGNPDDDNDNSNISRDLSVVSNPKVGMNCRSRPPPFLAKLYVMVVDLLTNDIVSWSPSKQSFIIWDRDRFSSLLLPKYFRHSNFSNFISQLNNYGFQKINCWEYFEYANPLFVEGREDLLMRIRRKSEKFGVSAQREDNSNDRTLMEVTMDILRSEQMNLELQLEELRGKEEDLVEEFATIEDSREAILVDQEIFHTRLIAHFVHQSIIEHLKDHRENDETEEPVAKILRLASPDNNNSSGDSPDQEDPTLYQIEVKPITITTPLDDSGMSSQGQKNIVDDSAFWKRIMEDDSA